MTTQNTINNVDVLKTVTPVQFLVDGFQPWLKGWPVKHAGPAPTAEMLTVALAFGKLRKPGPEAGFVAMQLRPEGASVAELSAAFNSGPAHNHSRELSANNRGEGLHYFTRVKGSGRFWLTFTQKGVKALERALQGFQATLTAGADSDATKPAGKQKAKGGTTKPKAEKATSDAPEPKAAASKRKPKPKAEKPAAEPDQATPDIQQQLAHSVEQAVDAALSDQPQQ